MVEIIFFKSTSNNAYINIIGEQMIADQKKASLDSKKEAFPLKGRNNICKTAAIK